MKTHIQPFKSLDKQLRDTIICKTVVKLNLGVINQAFDTLLNNLTDVDSVNRLNLISEITINELNKLLNHINDESKDTKTTKDDLENS